MLKMKTMKVASPLLPLVLSACMTSSFIIIPCPHRTVGSLARQRKLFNAELILLKNSKNNERDTFADSRVDSDGKQENALTEKGINEVKEDLKVVKQDIEAVKEEIAGVKEEIKLVKDGLQNYDNDKWFDKQYRYLKPETHANRIKALTDEKNKLLDKEKRLDEKEKETILLAKETIKVSGAKETKFHESKLISLIILKWRCVPSCSSSLRSSLICVVYSSIGFAFFQILLYTPRCVSFFNVHVWFFHYTIASKGKAYLETGRKFVKALRQELVQVPVDGVHGVLHGVPDISSNNQEMDIVITTRVHNFWEAVFTNSEIVTWNMSTRVCAVGSPGIGKSVTSLYFIRMLLFDKKRPVVYLRRTAQKFGVYYIFEPTDDNGVNVRLCPESVPPGSVPIIDRNPDAYYLCDPGATKDSCNPSESFNADVVINASGDDRHWGESEFTKAGKSNGIFLYFPLTPIDLLSKMKNYFQNGEEVTEDQLMDRHHKFLEHPSATL